MGVFDRKTPAISRAKCIGVHQGKETKIFSTVNFPVYSFLIEYVDGGRVLKTYSADSKKDMEELNGLLQYIEM